MIVIFGCVQTIEVRLRKIMRTLHQPIHQNAGE